MRDDIKVLTAIVLRHEETLIRIIEQITAMVAQTPASSIACGRSMSGWADWRSSRDRRQRPLRSSSSTRSPTLSPR